MNKIKEYKGIVILVTILLIGAFGWYEWKLRQTRIYCANERETLEAKFIQNNSSTPILNVSQYGDIVYSFCLRGKLRNQEADLKN